MILHFRARHFAARHFQSTYAASGHSLLANDILSASYVSTPNIYQPGTILADDVLSASYVTKPTQLKQLHAPLANDVTSPSYVTTPAVQQRNGLLANDIVSSSYVTKPTVLPVGGLLANDIVSTSYVTTPTLVIAGISPPIPVPIPPAHGGAGGAGYTGSKKHRERLAEVVEAAYRKALKIEPEVAEAIRAAIPSDSQRKSAQVSARRLRRPDFRRLAGDLGAVRDLLERVERIARAVQIQAAMDALIAYEVALEEDDMEVLLLAA
jgi:hypothetical protein